MMKSVKPSLAAFGKKLMSQEGQEPQHTKLFGGKKSKGKKPGLMFGGK
jgi:hypothetical protein